VTEDIVTEDTELEVVVEDVTDDIDAAIEESVPETAVLPGGLALRTLDLQNFRLGPTGLVVTGTPTLEEWAGIGELLRTLEHGLQWAIGDWICTGEGQFGDQAAQILDHTAWSVRTTAVYRWAASRVPPENRRTDLTFSHHLVVADLPPEEQRSWLEQAAAAEAATGEPWSVQRLKREMAVASAKGTEMRWLLVVDCDDERARDRLKSQLEKDGHMCRTAEATRKRAIKAGKASRKAKPVMKASAARGRKRGRPRGSRNRKR
jgi:hypothetical protein